MKKLLSREKLNNQGSTMMEVLVAFLVLMIILGSLTQVIKFAGNMMAKTKDIIEAQEDFNAEMYKENPTKIEIDTETFMLTIDNEKTDAVNNPSAVTLTLDRAGIDKYISNDDVLEMALYKFRVK